MSDGPIVLAPSFPTAGAATDGQSIYVVEASRALAAHLGRDLTVIALRLGDEAPFEEAPGARIHRVDPPRPIAGPFDLYAPATYRRTFEAFAHAALARVPARAPLWLHGYELGRLARIAHRRGHRVVGVLHYLLAQETECYLASAREPFRRAVMGPLGPVAELVPKRLGRAAEAVEDFKRYLELAPNAADRAEIQAKIDALE